MEELKNKRSVAKSQFTRTEKSLCKLLENEQSLEETIKRKFGEMSQRWQDVQNAHDVYMTMVPQDSFDKEEEWIDDLLVKFEAIEVDADQTLRKFTKVVQGKPKEEESKGGKSCESSVEKSRLQLKKLELEKFDGDIRKYPAFKERFKLYIEPMYPKTHIAFLLRSHLEAPVREEVENVEDDDSLLWQRLDYKYGNLRKYIDVILQDLSKVTKGDGKAALHMINTVEKAYRDLVRIGAGMEMSNSCIIAMIEKKLPEEMRKDWVKLIAEKEEVDCHSVFKLLMDFLERWRRIIEYDAAAIRVVIEKKAGVTNLATSKQGNAAKSEVCWLHEDGYHPVWKCKLFQMMPIKEKLDMVKQKQACEACLETSCQGAKNPDECHKKFRCLMTGCEKPNNVLLHQ